MQTRRLQRIIISSYKSLINKTIMENKEEGFYIIKTKIVSFVFLNSAIQPHPSANEVNLDDINNSCGLRLIKTASHGACTHWFNAVIMLLKRLIKLSLLRLILAITSTLPICVLLLRKHTCVSELSFHHFVNRNVVQINRNSFYNFEGIYLNVKKFLGLSINDWPYQCDCFDFKLPKKLAGRQ